MNFIRRVNRRNFYLSSQSFQFGDLIGICKLATKAKFQQFVCKIMPVRPKTLHEHDVNITSV